MRTKKKIFTGFCWAQPEAETARRSRGCYPSLGLSCDQSTSHSSRLRLLFQSLTEMKFALFGLLLTLSCALALSLGSNGAEMAGRSTGQDDPLRLYWAAMDGDQNGSVDLEEASSFFVKIFGHKTSKHQVRPFKFYELFQMPSMRSLLTLGPFYWLATFHRSLNSFKSWIRTEMA
jgi:hypothetical protein